MIPEQLNREIDYLNRHGASVAYSPTFLSVEEANHYWTTLMTQLEFNSDADSRVRIHGRWVDIPRRQTAYGDPGVCYSFSGCSVAARPWIPALASLRALIQEPTGFAANYVLANFYRDGADCIGWHRDDESDLGPVPDILSLSLGATRDFQLRRRDAGSCATRTVTLPLEHGSLLVMRDPTNRLWQHQLPRRGGQNPEKFGPRLNLTWRRITEYRPSSQTSSKTN